MEKIALVYFIKQVVGVIVPTAISALKFCDVGFHHQLVFLVQESIVCAWFDLLYFYACDHLIVSLVTLGFLIEIFFDCV